MDSGWLADSLVRLLRAMDDGPPKNLIARLMPDAVDQGITVTAADVTTALRSAPPADPVMTRLGLLVHKWDAESSDSGWTERTAPSTLERRQVICARLGIDADGAAALLERKPIFFDETIVISAPWDRWYDANSVNAREFYWPRYRDHLLNVKLWSPENVAALDLATSSVVERLSDPVRPAAYQSKGLVVGYVQSGKTANFTGVIAKAIDAGYRLVVVLTGTIEMLRAQTQRRIDMEMVGRQNIIGDFSVDQATAGGVDYQDDPAWRDGQFLDLGTTRVGTEILRLTGFRRDYQTQFKNLRIERSDVGKPLFDPANLFSSSARLVIAKKNSAVLGKLVADLQANRRAFAEIPVLIIDDESDQASVNTVDPAKVQAQKAAGRDVIERRAINQRIAQMLDLMPRAQYVGYTATPFANVFVDPSDEQGIYPKDFVIGLNRPPGYMGVEDFHDLDGEPLEDTPEYSNRAAFVRDLDASDTAESASARAAELSRALDMFVLTGACKLYRQSIAPSLKFRHHTMLIHESVATAAHRELAMTVRELWGAAAFTSARGLRRLAELYEKDVLPTSVARVEPGVPKLPHFDTLRVWIERAAGKIAEIDNNPVTVVNSDKEIEQQQLEFERNSTWRVLIGGAKLSRGFTVEGLTVTYFRRAVSMSDSLTQMGRWFGFRHGYRDLVRLYIDRRARFGRKFVDLYAAFEAIARDEAEFRRQLHKYSEWDGDRPRVLPSQIPPLVTQHLPWLKPTASNKMFNAVLQEQSARVLSPVGYPNELDKLRLNLDLWRPVMAAAVQDCEFPAAGQADLRAYVGQVKAAQLLEVVQRHHWMELYGERAVQPILNHLERLPLDDFLFVMPQPGDTEIFIAGVGRRRVISRDRRRRGTEDLSTFGEITDPKHRAFIQPLLASSRPNGHPLGQYWAAGRGVVLAYPMREQEPTYSSTARTEPDVGGEERGLILGFAIYLPASAVSDDRVLRFSVVQTGAPNAVTVDAHGPEAGTTS